MSRPVIITISRLLVLVCLFPSFLAWDKFYPQKIVDMPVQDTKYNKNLTGLWQGTWATVHKGELSLKCKDKCYTENAINFDATRNYLNIDKLVNRLKIDPDFDVGNNETTAFKINMYIRNGPELFRSAFVLNTIGTYNFQTGRGIFRGTPSMSYSASTTLVAQLKDQTYGWALPTWNAMNDSSLPFPSEDLSVPEKAEDTASLYSCPFYVLLQQVNEDENQLSSKIKIDVVSYPCAVHFTQTTEFLPTSNFSTLIRDFAWWALFFSCLMLIADVTQNNFAKTVARARRMSIYYMISVALVDLLFTIMILFLTAQIEIAYGALTLAAVISFITSAFVEFYLHSNIWRSHQIQAVQEDTARLRRRFILYYIAVYVFILVIGMILVAYLAQIGCIILAYIAIALSYHQIYETARNGFKQSVSPWFNFIQWGFRCFLAVYFLIWKTNFMNSPVNITQGVILIVLNSIWFILVMCQTFLSTTLGLSHFIKTRRYDYHRPIPAYLFDDSNESRPENDIEDLNAGTSKKIVAFVKKRRAPLEAPPQPTGTKTLTCSICMCDIEYPGDDYMITPCDHVFHSECLKKWMDIKPECPVCRSALK